jgi:hypothetical protein
LFKRGEDALSLRVALVVSGQVETVGGVETADWVVVQDPALEKVDEDLDQESASSDRGQLLSPYDISP